MSDDLSARLLCAHMAVRSACERADRAEGRCRELDAALTAIRDRASMENAMDPQWAASVATEALAHTTSLEAK